MLFIWIVEYTIKLFGWFLNLIPVDLSYFLAQIGESSFMENMIYFLPRANYLFPFDLLISTAIFCMALELARLWIIVVFSVYQQARIYIRGG